ncbi:hypothetical protein HDU84_003123 [Entophlyctis sp. JEL0112]|nr:hypothetical protein HDU84_003123 [Entophlyctis sp. JEL0112]
MRRTRTVVPRQAKKFDSERASTNPRNSTKGMLTPVPDAFKSITAFVQRADELAVREPVVSYYCTVDVLFSPPSNCNFYAVKLAIDINASHQSPECQTYLLGMLDTLEAAKAALKDNEAITNDVVGYAHIENFALKIFNAADTEDRAGKASKKTAKSFLAASTFLEVLKVFGAVDESVEEKIRYGRFKAVDILKALKEGRQPTPGTGGEPAEQSEIGPDPGAGGAVGGAAAPPPPTAPPLLPDFDPLFAAQFSAPPVALHTPASTPILPTAATVAAPFDALAALASFPSIPASAPASASAPVAAANVPAAKTPQPLPRTTATAAPAVQANSVPLPLDHTVVTSVTKNCKFAISALQYDDVDTAVENLERALATLRACRR